MKLTRRGWGVVGVTVGGLLMAGLYGPRSLNAVVAPGVVALAAAVLAVWRVQAPSVDRVGPEDAFVGETRTVELAVTATKSSFSGRIIDHVSDGLDASGNEVATTIDDELLTYTVAYVERGEHAVGPAEVLVRDVLGLLETRFDFPTRTTVLAYPPIRDLGARASQELAAIPEYRLVARRGEFDSLREYERGDALRDIHWKSSAKRVDEELVVKEYVAQDDLGALTVVAESAAADTAGDAMAEAAASIVAHLLGSGLTVGVSAPDGVIEPGEGDYQRTRMLELLARTGPGNVPAGEAESGDIRIYGNTDGTATVTIDDRTIPFTALTGGRDVPHTQTAAQ